jgi:hypothetical protein
MSDWMRETIHAHHHQKENPKMAGLMLIVIGFFLAPFLVGIPMIFYGGYLVAK